MSSHVHTNTHAHKYTYTHNSVAILPQAAVVVASHRAHQASRTEMRGKRCFDLTKDEMENPTKLVRLCADVPAASTSGSKEYKEEQETNRTAFLNNLCMLYRNPGLNLRCEKWLQEKVSYEALKDKCDGHVCVARSFRSLGDEVFLKVISKCCPQVTRQTWETAANQDPEILIQVCTYLLVVSAFLRMRPENQNTRVTILALEKRYTDMGQARGNQWTDFNILTDKGLMHWKECGPWRLIWNGTQLDRIFHRPTECVKKIPSHTPVFSDFDIKELWGDFTAYARKGQTKHMFHDWFDQGEGPKAVVLMSNQGEVWKNLIKAAEVQLKDEQREKAFATPDGKFRQEAKDSAKKEAMQKAREAVKDR